MELLLDSLNPSQGEAATKTDRHVRIVAGAGSGKTRVLIARIEYLIRELGIFPSRILAITFTNKAAKEMKDRLDAQIGPEANDVRISTIHSLCVRILREDAAALGLPKNFTIMDTDDQKSLLKTIYKELSVDSTQIPASMALSVISDNKMNQVTPEEAEAKAYGEDGQKLAQIYSEYEKRKEEMKALDFDDLLLEADHLLKNRSDIRDKWQNRLDYIHVDEFQDVDPVQYSIIQSLTRKDAILCVVGDPDQTIYTWRGASVNIILNFDRDFKPCHTVILKQNYRSTQPILNASNALIEHNKKRIQKELFSELPGEELIVMHEAEDDDSESAYAARQINELHRQGVPYSDMAILYRANYISRNFEKKLRSVNIPYRIYGGIRYYDRAEIKDILSYLRLLSEPDPSDPKQKSLDLAVLRVINQPKRGIGARTIEKLQEEAAKRDVNLLEVMKEPKTLSPAAAKKAMKFYETIDDLKKEKDNVSLEDLIGVVLDYSGYEDMLIETKEDERLENVKELANDIAEARKRNPDLTLESYLQDIALFTDKNSEEVQNGVSLMTVHAAKGTEFPMVIVGSMNEGIFPSSRSITEGGLASLEEERRLMYVAMTRAKEHLYVTWNRGFSYMLNDHKTPSRFLKEIPDEFVNRDLEHVEEKETGKPQPKTQPIRACSYGQRPKSRSVHFRKNDKVEHSIYGEGVVISVQGEVASIAFPHPTGVKKLNVNHPSLKKIKK